MTFASATASTSLTEGGPTLLDLLVDVSELRIVVTGPATPRVPMSTSRRPPRHSCQIFSPLLLHRPGWC
jgi:hypothetical protein